MPEKDVHDIRFKLHNKDGADIRFTTNLVHVLWVNKVGNATAPCPDEPSHLPGEFFAFDVNDDQDELRVINTNMKPKHFLAFRLNFVPAGELDVPVADYIAYDPIGNNQNGGFPLIVPEDLTDR